MEKILLVIIVICLFILIIQKSNLDKTEYFKETSSQERYVPEKYVPERYVPEKYISEKYVSERYIPERYIPGKKLANFVKPFKIDYDFPKQKFSISNKKYYLDIKKTKKNANLKDIFKPDKINYNPMNAIKLYEKKNKK